MKYLIRARWVLVATFALSSGAPGPTMETLEKIAPGIWFRQGEVEKLGHCNNVVIEMKDYLIVVDANFPDAAKALLSAIKSISNKPVKYVFDTHHHGDHLYGNTVWTQAGATTLAYKGVTEELKRYEPARWRQVAAARADLAALKISEPEPPKQTFDKSPFVLQDSTRRVEFHFFGWAHTRGDGFVYLPKEQILCTGDAAINGPYTGTADANIGNWGNVLRQAMKLPITRVLPAHGPAGGREILVGQEKFIGELYAAVKAGVEQGKSLEDLLGVRKPGPPGPTPTVKIQFSPAVSPWVGKYLRGQVKDTFEEIKLHQPHGEIAGGK